MSKIKKIVGGLALAGILTASTLAALQFTNTPDAQTLEYEAESYQHVVDWKNRLLKPSREHIKEMDTRSTHYFMARGIYHKAPVNWDEGKVLGFGESKLDRFKTQIINDADAMILLMYFIGSTYLDEKDPTKIKESQYTRGYHLRTIEKLNTYLPYVSPTVATMIANPFETTLAIKTNQPYKGINVADYILVKNGTPLDVESNYNDTRGYYHAYKEFWIDYVFNDVFYHDLIDTEKPDFKYVGVNWY
ncbi:hypothetical protein MHO82_20135 [Vibrio sp. Of7-15]|uniref:hypothetical protein n=1 Tax=Vibrio sp. Of7-15 TaxID=2724879 RepID=UPI001EF24128|nr:hypothetical protein [Vibrio sp. Of7-15]MCG7499179.1 hypothetical protein [Vibrio sp. Of7-15]